MPFGKLNLAEEKRAALLSLLVGILLLAIKFVAYGLTGSAAIFSDALEGIVNVISAGVAVYAVSLAAQPADAEHPYGHGKIEFLSAGFEGGMILLAAVGMAARAVESMWQGPKVSRVESGLMLMAIAMLINGGMGWFLVSFGRKRQSIALEADGHHLLSDAVTSAVVLLALALVRLTRWPWIDPIAALLVTAYIAWIAVGLIRRSAAGLMDKQDLADEKQLSELLDAHVGPNGKEPRICSYHKLRHRHSGRYHWVDFHIMLPAWWNIERGHKVASAIEYEMELLLGEGNATAHIEPCADKDCGYCAGPHNHETADEHR